MFIPSHPVIITKESKMLVAFCRSQRIKGKNHPKMTTGIQYRHTYDSPVASSFPGKRVKLSFAVPRQRSGNLVSGRAAPQLCPQELRSRADNRGHSLCASRARLLLGHGEQNRTLLIPPRGSPWPPHGSQNQHSLHSDTAGSASRAVPMKLSQHCSALNVVSAEFEFQTV